MNRIFQSILLGITANIVINFIFNPENPDFLWSEFLAAILLSWPIIELNRLLDNRLVLNNQRIKSFGKRLLLHLIVLFSSIVIVLNVLGNLYIFLQGHSFYTLKEILTINTVSFFMATFLTGFNWMAHYYLQWKITETNLLKSEKNLSEIKTKQNATHQTIQLTKGTKQINVPINDIIAASIKNGITIIETNTQLKSAIFSGTIKELENSLPSDLFFLARRNMIIRKETVQSVSSGIYGKVEIELKIGEKELIPVTISRGKASTFRKWLNSDSLQYK